MSATPTFTTPDRPLTWLITGCSSGIGLELCRYVLAQGHRLIATSRNPGRTADLVREVEEFPAASTGRHRWLELDVVDRSAGRSLARRLEEEAITVDVLVNNAGFAIAQTIEHATEEELQALMDTHYFGPIRLIQAVLPSMRKQRFGVIVYISTGSALEARPSLGLYGSSKAAGDAITKTLAKEVAPFNVRSFYVSLGGFRTNMASATRAGTTALDPDYHGSMAEKIITGMTTGHGAAVAHLRGDPRKLVQAIFEVTTGTGIGKGREAETMLPLGRDEAARVLEVRNSLDHALEVFGDVCNNVECDD